MKTMENRESKCNTNNKDAEQELKTRSSGSTFDFDKKTWATDFTLIVEGKTLHVTKAVLGLASPVFERMFQSDFKELGSKEMELPGKSFADMLEFLRCIYPNSPTSVNRKNVSQILPLAEEYQVTQLKSSCEDVLLTSIKKGSGAERLYEILNLACLYNLQKLREKCIQILSSKENKLDIANATKELPAEVMVEILQRINAQMEETNAVLVSHMQNSLAENEMLRKENKILKQIWSVKEKPQKLDHSMNWKGETIVMVMHRVHYSQKYAPAKRQITMWDVHLIITAEVCPRQTGGIRQSFTNDWLCVEVHSTNGNIICSIEVKCKVIHMYGHGEIASSHTYNFTVNNQSFCGDMFPLSNFAYGQYDIEGDLPVIVSIYMSEPIKRK